MPDAQSNAKPSSLAAFVALVQKAVSAAKAANTQVGANSVVVDRTGKSYPTINDALASITDASQQEQYVVLIGPGTYPEVVACKSWVFLSGSSSDPGQVVITSSSVPKPFVQSTIIAASHSAVQNCTVQAVTEDPSAPGISALGGYYVFDFDIENCRLIAIARNLMNVTGAGFTGPAGPSSPQVNVAYTTVTATGSSWSLAIGVSHASLQAMQSTFSAEGGSSPGWGGASWDGGTLLFENCTVQGAGYSLYKNDDASSVTANQCTLKGPVGPGVVVNP
jgi:pectin methylesterase-like acyl-CoA thioesterase